MTGHLLFVAVMLLAAQTVHPAPDFAIRFDHKGCHYEYIDTFKGTYSHVGATRPVPFTLSDEQRTTLFKAIMSARFFDLPAVRYGNSQEAADNYELEVWNDGLSHKVSWSVDWLQLDAGRPLLELLRTLLRMLDTHPDVQRLPTRGDGCFGGPPKIR